MTHNVDVRWTQQDEDNVVGYDIEYRPVSQQTYTPLTSQLHTPGVLAYNFVHAGLADGTYMWRVSSYNMSGGQKVSSPWKTSSQLTLTTAPAAPATLTVVEI